MLRAIRANAGTAAASTSIKIETIAIERAKKLFGAEHANVQPHSGSQANFAVYTAVLQPGDKVLGKFFVGLSTDSKTKVRQHVIDFLCKATGGPCAYTGRDMKLVHTGLGITKAEWDASVQHLICKAIGFFAAAPRRHDAGRDAAQILNQDKPQADRHRPELADGQRLHRLVFIDKLG